MKFLSIATLLSALLAVNAAAPEAAANVVEPAAAADVEATPAAADTPPVGAPGEAKRDLMCRHCCNDDDWAPC